MLDREECGRRIRAAREAAGLSQEEAAERLGVERATYTQYERGRRVPTWTKLYELIEALGLSPAILFPEFIAGGKARRAGK